MRLRKTDTIKDICPIYEDLTQEEQLSILYDYLVLINNGNYFIATLIYLAAIDTAGVILELFEVDLKDREIITMGKARRIVKDE